MVVYDKYVQFSVFNGTLTLHADVGRQYCRTIFVENTTKRPIKLIVDDEYYSAELMCEIDPSKNRQNAYIRYQKNNSEFISLKEKFKELFAASYPLVMQERKEIAEMRALGQVPPKAKGPEIERIVIYEKDNEPYTYRVEYELCANKQKEGK